LLIRRAIQRTDQASLIIGQTVTPRTGMNTTRSTPDVFRDFCVFGEMIPTSWIRQSDFPHENLSPTSWQDFLEFILPSFNFIDP
jgi:hypothetical protein